MTQTRTPGPLNALFAPRGIAIVGASRNPAKLGAAMARSLEGFAAAGGHLALVNGRDDTMYPSIGAASADGPIDLAVLCVPAAACAAILAEAAGAGVRAALVCGGGFAEVADGQGAEHQRRLTEIARATGIRVLGPNTSGFLVPGAHLTASFVPGTSRVPSGGVAVVAASGGVNHALAFALAEAGHGISLAVGLGNGADVTAPDVLDHLAGDPDTTAVALHVETVADGPRLIAAVRRLTARRPVVALVVGRSDVGAFAASHTGALATSWRSTRAALAQAGAVLVGDERELVDAVGALAVTRARAAGDPGVGVVTAQAGPGLLLLDNLQGRSIAVPELTRHTQDGIAALLPPLTYQRNPVDTGRPGPAMSGVLKAVGADPGVDIVAAYALHEPGAVDLVAAARAGRTDGVPLVLGLGGTGEAVARDRDALRAAGIAVAGDPAGVAAATAALVADARARSIGGGEPAAPGAVVEVADDYDEGQAKDLLDHLGIATMPRRRCATRSAAHEAFDALGGDDGDGGVRPVAAKLLDAAVLHKTEIGGVHLGITGHQALDAALDRLDAAGARRYLIEAMAPPGIDLIVGARRDPVFGPVVLVGLGGTVAEALADVAVRLAPLSVEEASGMPSELSGRALLAGWRGGPVLAPRALGEVVAALGGLLAANPRIDEIEINPLRLTRTGLIALDAVILTRKADDAHPDR
ncbi:pimeloyl-CoA synthetase [Sphaerisporangium krabiense]|uniref:Acetyltransferase n=1 Tax=Sphaerisporangium krabiense TaxID=763782 RepID=A0A7W8Z5N9_9ACTN|nr:acetate--CoA ligase family protein [Sphaerisporangium krabiense]MBB5627931.1 acetyltransferase [Sphaerisporangium krabiense]GII62091.1 pimeloyl-CoA synthetase [Sphaerisporangium krabiense]